MIELLEVPSPLTVQDSGRAGYRKLGVPVSGFMDDYSARIANYLVGNPPGGTPLLEFLLRGADDQVQRLFRLRGCRGTSMLA